MSTCAFPGYQLCDVRVRLPGEVDRGPPGEADRGPPGRDRGLLARPPGSTGPPGPGRSPDHDKDARGTAQQAHGALSASEPLSARLAGAGGTGPGHLPSRAHEGGGSPHAGPIVDEHTFHASGGALVEAVISAADTLVQVRGVSLVSHLLHA